MDVQPQLQRPERQQTLGVSLPPVSRTEGDRKRLCDLVKDINYCQLVTKTEHGHLHPRPMRILRHDENGFWFGTRLDSNKVEEMSAHHTVSILLQRDNYKFSISGLAIPHRGHELVEDL